MGEVMRSIKPSRFLMMAQRAAPPNFASLSFARGIYPANALSVLNPLDSDKAGMLHSFISISVIKVARVAELSNVTTTS